MHGELDALRAELAGLDREIVRLTARRLKLAGEIGRAKLEAGLPARDYVQEREVLERAREAAADHGVPAALAREILLALIRSSLVVQERDRVAAAGAGAGRRALVIGGAGKMGLWFVRFLGSQGYTVEVADPAGPVEDLPHRADWRTGDLDHDIIVVAAPLGVSGGILEGLADAFPPGLLFDIGSLKSPLRAGLAALARRGARAASIHPMFGPDTALLYGRHVVFIDLGRADAVAEAKALFAPTMAVPVDMDLESHDRLVAYVLGLSHALNIAFFTALAGSGEDAPLLATLSSTTFDAQLAVAARVAAENPHLYFEIQAGNDHGADALDALARAVDRVRTVVRDRDEAGFVELMRRGDAYLSGRRVPGAAPFSAGDP